MIARISSRLPTSEERLWHALLEPRSLQFVAAPLLTFEPVDGTRFDGRWQVGKAYTLKLRFLRFLPVGRHTIRLVRIDERARTILTRESGRLARVWNHAIRFHAVDSETVSYTDEIEIRAGLLTPFIWAFAQLFYRHRQRRWRLLLQRGEAQGQE